MDKKVIFIISNEQDVSHDLINKIDQLFGVDTEGLLVSFNDSISLEMVIENPPKKRETIYIVSSSHLQELLIMGRQVGFLMGKCFDDTEDIPKVYANYGPGELILINNIHPINKKGEDDNE